MTINNCFMFLPDGTGQIGPYKGGTAYPEGTWIYSRRHDAWYVILDRMSLLREEHEVPIRIRTTMLILM